MENTIQNKQTLDCSVKDLVKLTADDTKTVAPITVPETGLKAKGSQKTNSTKFFFKTGEEIEQGQ